MKNAPGPSVRGLAARRRSPDGLRAFLDKKVAEYNRPAFIADDPISVPHSFREKRDIEIAGFFSAIFAWGSRTTIIQKSRQLLRLMDDAPHQFVLQHTDSDLRRLIDFKHRTFNATDLLYFMEFFRHHYSRFESLEDAFLLPWQGRPAPGQWNAEQALTAFYSYFFSLEEAPHRTRKHIATPAKRSGCKRINLFLRWMVRRDDKGVDFGIWRRIPPSGLVCPIDLHVGRVAKRFGLLDRAASDWTAALRLTGQLLNFDREDPVKYDFALFGLGVMEKF
ncbi:MAG TPA: TIGR02757 family protein [Puia sp.]|nr:TIGR02757 family protein [Puia sp.]